jgi:hypothetical protein
LAAAAAAACCCRAARNAACFAFFRSLFSKGPQRWQNLHCKPALQTLLWKNSHGWHVPQLWPAEPIEGRGSGEPRAAGESPIEVSSWTTTDCGDISPRDTRWSMDPGT